MVVQELKMKLKHMQEKFEKEHQLRLQIQEQLFQTEINLEERGEVICIRQLFIIYII